MAKVANKIRSREPKDTSPIWTGCETWDANQFFRNFHNAMTYYRLEFNGKDLKPAVIKWMTGVGCTK
jgi:hypothetical protein